MCSTLYIFLFLARMYFQICYGLTSSFKSLNIWLYYIPISL